MIIFFKVNIYNFITYQQIKLWNSQNYIKISKLKVFWVHNKIYEFKNNFFMAVNESLDILQSW